MHRNVSSTVILYDAVHWNVSSTVIVRCCASKRLFNRYIVWCCAWKRLFNRYIVRCCALKRLFNRYCKIKIIPSSVSTANSINDEGDNSKVVRLTQLRHWPGNNELQSATTWNLCLYWVFSGCVEVAMKQNPRWWLLIFKGWCPAIPHEPWGCTLLTTKMHKKDCICGR